MSKLEVKDKRLSHIMAVIQAWREKYHVDKNSHDIIFQNRETFANVRFTNNSLNAIREHPKGFENIPDAIAHPHEIWSRWENAGDQKIVIRTYLLFGKGFAYVVITKKGHIDDALALSSRSVEKYRKGVILSR
jgi:hypothetical protein